MNKKEYNKKEISYENAQKALHNVLLFTGVENFEIFQIPVFQTEFILTVKLGDSSLPKLVMIHGYGSGSGLFYKMLKQLSENFHIYMLDMLGMAGSSRPDFKAVTPKECVDFFTESIEEWRKWLGLVKFYLLGHSFGGYISGLYAVKYSQYIQKLLLISPVGLSVKPQDFENQKDFFYDGKKIPRFFVKIIKHFWGQEASSLNFGRKLPYCFQHFFLKRRAVVRLNGKNNSNENNEALADYQYQIIFSKESSEKSLFRCFNHALHAEISLGQKDQLCNPDFPVPVIVVYGDRDWVYKIDSLSAKYIVEANQFQESQIHMISDSDHNIMCDQSDKLANLIIQTTYNSQYIKKNQKLELLPEFQQLS